MLQKSRRTTRASHSVKPMRILHLASFHRWTGAAAPAFAEVLALRDAGVEAHYAFVGGSNLEQKLRDVKYAHAILEKLRSPGAFIRSLRRLAHLVDREKIDIIHAHLAHDHALARAVRRGVVIRTVHNRRTLRRDPYTRWLFAGTAAICVANSSFVHAPLIARRSPLYTPPPLDRAQFHARGDDARARYGFEATTPVVGFIGKITQGRGFEEALDIFSRIVTMRRDARMMIVGHGPHRPFLEKYSRELGIAESVTWAGYHEADLPEHFRAMDVLLFTAPGSDEGHRAILESIGCGTPVVSYPIAGTDSILGGLEPTLNCAEKSPDEAAARANEILGLPRRSLAAELSEVADRFAFPECAARLIRLYEGLLSDSTP